MKAPGLAVFLVFVVLALCTLAVAQSNSPSTTSSTATTSTTSTTSATTTTSATSTSATTTSTSALSTSSTTTTSTSTTPTSTSTSTTSSTSTTIQTLNTAFSQNGLPASAAWSVSFNGTSSGAPAANTIAFLTAAGNYQFAVANVSAANSVYVPSPANGILAAGSSQAVIFSVVPTTTTTTSTSSSSSTIPMLNTTFSETGLPANTVWSVTFAGLTKNASATSGIAFGTSSGNYPFYVSNVIALNAVYVPSPASGLLAAGSVALVRFGAVNITAVQNATTTSTTSSVTTSTSINATPYQTIRLKNTAGKSTATFVAPMSVRVIPNQSVLHDVEINFSVGGRTAMINITNQSRVPPILPRPRQGYYQYIQINGTSGGANIDSYVTGVVYNFSVPAAWLQLQGLSSGSIQLLMYSPAAKSWRVLPTALTGSNSTSYFYSASSSSLSAYVVGVNTVSTTSTTKSTTLNQNSNWQTYFFGFAGVANAIGTTSCTYTANFPTVANSQVCSRTGYKDANITVIGYNTVLYGNVILPASGGANGKNYNSVLVGIGANVIFLNNGLTANTGAPASTNSLTFTIGTANSVAYLFFTLAGNSIRNTVLPAGCTLNANIAIAAYAGAAAANCLLTPAGSYTTRLVPNTVAGVGYANTIAAIVFPPYNVELQDYPPIGNIITNGTQQVNGNTIFTIGTNNIVQVAPACCSFATWAVDPANAFNVIISGLTSAKSSLTIMGQAIITAIYNLPYSLGANTVNTITATKASPLNGGANTANTFFAVGSSLRAATSVTCGAWTTNFLKIASNELCANAGVHPDNVTVIGYNGVFYGNFVATTTTGATPINTAFASIGLNVIFTNNDATANSVATNSLTFTVNTLGSQVVLLYATGGNSILSVDLPDDGGCTLDQVVNTNTVAGAATANCLITTRTGQFTTYLAARSPTLAGAVANSISAIVFPPYSIILKDNPGSGNIITNGTQQANGNVISILGTNTLVPVAPTGKPFVSFSVDTFNAANVILTPIAGRTANTITVMGSAIITATYVTTCQPVISNTLITFPSTSPGSFSPTSNTENVAIIGTATSNIWVSGGNWANIPGPSPTFNVGNTLWSLTSGQNIGTQLTGTSVDTKEPVTSGTGNGNVIFFGLNIPTGTAGGAYNQIITISSSC